MRRRGAGCGSARSFAPLSVFASNASPHRFLVISQPLGSCEHSHRNSVVVSYKGCSTEPYPKATSPQGQRVRQIAELVARRANSSVRKPHSAIQLCQAHLEAVTEEEEDFVETAEVDVEEEGEATMEVAASEGIEAVGFGVTEAEAVVVAAEEGMVDRPAVASKTSRSSRKVLYRFWFVQN